MVSSRTSDKSHSKLKTDAFVRREEDTNTRRKGWEANASEGILGGTRNHKGIGGSPCIPEGTGMLCLRRRGNGRTISDEGNTGGLCEFF